IRVQPDAGDTLRFASRVPGTAVEVRDVYMVFAYCEAFTESSPAAEERLIMGVLLGEPSVHPLPRDVVLRGALLASMLVDWSFEGAPEQYRAGTWGPPDADEMLGRSGRSWRRP